MNNSSIIDMEEVMERLLGDKGLLVELLEDFIRDFQKSRKLLEKLIRKKDYEQIKKLAHSLKGSAGNISVKPMHNSFMLIEYLATTRDTNLTWDLIEDIDKQFLELQSFLKELKTKEGT